MLAQSTTALGGNPPAGANPVRNSSRSERKIPSRRILVVDDEALMRWSVAETLAARGYDVVEAEDGRSAIRALVDEPDLVLLDLRLPDSNDLGVLEAMHRLSPAMPIILMTAFGTQEVVEEALRIGAFSVLAKPFDIGDLNPIVSRALATRLS